MTNLHIPDIADVIGANKIVSPLIHKTPIRQYPELCDLLDADVWVKHENFQILGSFKVRGGIYLAHKVLENHDINGFITASTGNHGQSIAFAAKISGIPSKVVVPIKANPAKVSSMISLGAEVIHHGNTFDESLEFAESLSKNKKNFRFVHPANEPYLITGVATYSLEIHENINNVDYLFVPVGAGSGAAGASIVSEAISPKTNVIGSQSESSPAAYLAWKTGRFNRVANKTVAEGLATGHAYEYPINILKKKLNNFVLVSDQDIENSVILLLKTTRSLVEHAGAATLAAALKLKKEIKSKRIVLVLSGSNITLEQLRKLL